MINITLKIFLIGVIVLVGAIIINTVASYLGLLTWYTFLSNNSAIKVSIINYIFLFLIYPMLLGVIANYSTTLM